MARPRKTRPKNGLLAQVVTDDLRTATEIAAEIGVSPGTLSRWISGKHVPDPSTLSKLEKVTGLDAGDLGYTVETVPVVRLLSSAPTRSGS
jgi:transcriptional regulator with XRE-family HTH domain